MEKKVLSFDKLIVSIFNVNADQSSADMVLSYWWQNHIFYCVLMVLQCCECYHLHQEWSALKISLFIWNFKCEIYVCWQVDVSLMYRYLTPFILNEDFIPWNINIACINTALCQCFPWLCLHGFFYFFPLSICNNMSMDWIKIGFISWNHII